MKTFVEGCLACLAHLLLIISWCIAKGILEAQFLIIFVIYTILAIVNDGGNREIKKEITYMVKPI